MQVTVAEPVLMVAPAIPPAAVLKYLAGRVKTMVEPADNRFAGVTPSVRVPVVVMPGNLSPGTAVTELVAAATEVTVEPVAGKVTLVETTEITPLGLVADVMACKVKVPLAVFEAILQFVARIKEWAVVAAIGCDAIVHVIVVKPAVPVAGGHAATGAVSAVVQRPVAPAPPVVV